MAGKKTPRFKQKVLVTGANGFLATNIILELLKRGYSVRGLMRPGRKAQKVIPKNRVEFITGDLLNKKSLKEAVKGCTYIINAAAKATVWPRKSKEVEEINFNGTVNLVKAAKEEKIKKFIHIGTANSFGFGSKEEPGDETKPFMGEKYNVSYMSSKKEVQDYLLIQAEKKFPVVIINPTFMLGPYGVTSNQFIIQIKKGKVPGYTRGGKNFVDVRDVAVATVNSINKGKRGECYITGGENLDYKTIFKKIAKGVFAKTPSIKFPCWLAKLYGTINGWKGNISGKDPKITYTTAKISCDEHYFSSKKAIKVLDLPHTPIEKSIKDAYEWLREEGYIKKK